MEIIPSAAPKHLTSDTAFSNYLLTVYSYSKIPKTYGMEEISKEEVMDKLDMFQSIFGKIDKFLWWALEIITSDPGSQFTWTEFKEEFQTRGVHLTLAAPEHQEMNGQVEVTWITLRTIARSLKVHAIFSEAYIHFTLMCTEDYILQVLPMKELIKEGSETTTPFKIVTGTKPSILHYHVLFCP